MTTLTETLNNYAREAGFASLEELKTNYNPKAYETLIRSWVAAANKQQPTNNTSLRANPNEVIYLEAYLMDDPATFVRVKTKWESNRAKRRSIQKDISNQQFPRWAPFANKALDVHYKIRVLKEDLTPYNS